MGVTKGPAIPPHDDHDMICDIKGCRKVFRGPHKGDIAADLADFDYEDYPRRQGGKAAGAFLTYKGTACRYGKCAEHAPAFREARRLEKAEEDDLNRVNSTARRVTKAGQEKGSGELRRKRTERFGPS